MKTKLFTIGIAFISMNAFAQITVTDTDLVGIGDVIFQAYDSVPGQAINTGNTGANQSWDFSTLQVTELDTTTIISPIGTPYASIHPTANLCIKNDNDISDIMAKDFVLASPTRNRLSEYFPGTQTNAKISA